MMNCESRLVVTIILTLSGAACGKSSGAAPVLVTITDTGINIPGKVPAGPTTYQLVNNGSKVCDFGLTMDFNGGVKKGFGGEVKRSYDVAAGATITVELDNKPGTYRVDCNNVMDKPGYYTFGAVQVVVE